MDGFTEMMLAKTGLIAMGWARRSGPALREAIKSTNPPISWLWWCGIPVSQSNPNMPKSSAADLGMETIYEFDVVDMPVTVAVDAGGTSAHITGPAEWQNALFGRNSKVCH